MRTGRFRIQGSRNMPTGNKIAHWSAPLRAKEWRRTHHWSAADIHPSVWRWGKKIQGHSTAPPDHRRHEDLKVRGRHVVAPSTSFLDKDQAWR